MKRFQSVILNGLVICVITGSSFASTISVAKSGGDYPTIQAGVTAANADDTVLVKAGTYNEAVTFGKSGSASNGYITLKGETGAILDGVGKGEQGVTIADKNYIKVIGMEVRNFAGGGTPIGISIEGSSGTIEIRNNIVHTIENPNGNAHGIAVYGTDQRHRH
jgi:nitrous oxidase accessory protein NosD